MSMMDCQYCWSTPCECGVCYRNWSKEAINRHIEVLKRVKQIRRDRPELCSDPKKFYDELMRIEAVNKAE